MRDAPIELLKSDFGVMKHTFVEKDELVIQKWRDTQQSFELTLSEHMEFAQRVFGLSVGLGVHVFVPCPLKKLDHWRQSKTDTRSSPVM